jgi:type IV pilus assembly protein PilA
MTRQQGFTLIELMIVVAIIAILAAIAISQYQDYIVRSQVSEGSSLADGLKTAVAEFVNGRGRFANGSGATANVSYGVASAASITGSYVSSVGITGGVITAHYSSQNGFKANTALNGQTLSFSPVTHAGSIEWVCNKSNTLAEKYVPSICRN